MEKKRIGPVWHSTLIDMTRDLTEETSKFKNIMFRSTLGTADIRTQDIDRLLTAYNNYLRFWEQYADEVKDGMSNCRAEKVDIRTIDYNDIKDFIYASYDYASVLQFADGIFRGVKDKKFTDSEDIHDFFDHTVSKAFDDIDPSIAGVLDTFLRPTDYTDVVDNLQFNYFKSLRNNSKVFNSRTRTELYKAIEKTVKYLVDNINDLDMGTSYNGTRVRIASINKILEYAELSAVVYASRIFIIGYYARPFIEFIADKKGKDDEKVDAASESVECDPMMEAAASYGEPRYHTFLDVDDAILRGPGETKKLCDTFDAFINELDPIVNPNDRSVRRATWDSPYISESKLQGNMFAINLLDNPIVYRISTASNYGKGFQIRGSGGVNHAGMNELVEFLRGAMYDQKLGLGSSRNDRHAILHVIRGTAPKKDTLDGYRELASDLHDFAIVLCVGISRLLGELSDVTQRELNNAESSLPGANTGSECMRLLSYMYRDVAFAFIQKARYIEMKMNQLAEESDKKVFQDVSIRVPGGLEDNGININDTMMCAVPDTMRMPINLIDLYALPSFEEMQMFDDFLRADPMFESDMYLTESLNIASLINAIISMIRASFNKFKSFMNDKNVQGAIQWTAQHEQQLRKLNFNGKSMKAIKFRQGDNGTEQVSVSIVARNMINKLNAFKEDDASTEEKAKAFVKSLYPSEVVFNWFEGTTDEQAAAAKYRNYILFAANETTVKDTDPEPVEIASTDLSKQLNEWVTTVKGGDAALKEHGDRAIELEKAINSVKAKLVTMTNEANRQQSQSGTPPTAESKTDGKTENGTTSSQQTNNNGDDNARQVMLSTMLSGIQTATRRLWTSAAQLYIDYIMTEYRYIKEAYGIANR